MAQPVSTFVAHQWLCDHFGHLNARHYAAAFDDAVLVFWNGMGLAVPAAGAAGAIPVTARLSIEYRSEVTAGAVLGIFAEVARIGGKSATIRFQMHERPLDRVVATCETVEVFMDALERSSAAIPDHIRAALSVAPGSA